MKRTKGIISPAGAIGACIAIGTLWLMEMAKIDDPVGATGVHFAAAGWGVIAVGIFGKNDFGLLAVSEAFNDTLNHTFECTLFKVL